MNILATELISNYFVSLSSSYFLPERDSCCIRGQRGSGPIDPLLTSLSVASCLADPYSVFKAFGVVMSCHPASLKPSCFQEPGATATVRSGALE